HPCPGADLEALLAEDTRRLANDFSVHPRQDRRHGFEHRDFGAKAQPDTSELQPDDAAADHHQMPWNGWKRKSTRGIDYPLIVELQEGKLHGYGTGGEENPLASQNGLPIAASHLDGVCTGKSTEAAHPVDLVLLE